MLKTKAPPTRLGCDWASLLPPMQPSCCSLATGAAAHLLKSLPCSAIRKAARHVLLPVSGSRGVTLPTAPRGESSEGWGNTNETSSPYSGKVSSPLRHDWSGNDSLSGEEATADSRAEFRVAPLGGWGLGYAASAQQDQGLLDWGGEHFLLSTGCAETQVPHAASYSVFAPLLM